MLRFCKFVVSRKFCFRIRDVQNSKKRGRVEFLKLQKDYSFINTIDFKSTNIITSKHFLFFKTKLFHKIMGNLNLFASGSLIFLCKRIGSTTGYRSFARKNTRQPFTKCYTRQTTLGKRFIGKRCFAECFSSGTRQRLCRVPQKHSANIF